MFFLINNYRESDVFGNRKDIEPIGSGQPGECSQRFQNMESSHHARKQKYVRYSLVTLLD